MTIDHAPAAADGFADRLKARTWTLHREAERSGVLREVLRGQAERRPYAMLLRNLLPIYEALEAGLDRHARTPAVGPLAQPAVYRAAALRTDLHHIAGAEGLASLPFLPAAQRYRARVLDCADGDGDRLVAHAYVRFLGDLNGGQILKRLLGRHLGLGPEGLALYDFPLAGLAESYRASIDRAGAALSDAEPVLAEGADAFRLTIALSEEVLAAARAGQPPVMPPAGAARSPDAPPAA